MDQGFGIVILAGILSITTYNVIKLFVQHGGVDRRKAVELPGVEKRIAELEHRVSTLQDLVIGGEFDVQRRLRAAEPARPIHTDRSELQPNVETLRHHG